VSVKRWGLYKIREGLMAKGVKSAEIDAAIKTLDKVKYQENLDYLVERKVELQPEFAVDVSKLYRYLQSKGYESDKIGKVLREKKLMS
jgi:SOS response regulatory protein OraA/RecX